MVGEVGGVVDRTVRAACGALPVAGTRTAWGVFCCCAGGCDVKAMMPRVAIVCGLTEAATESTSANSHARKWCDAQGIGAGALVSVLARIEATADIANLSMRGDT